MPEISSASVSTAVGTLPLSSPYLLPSEKQTMIIFPRLEKLSEFVGSLPVDCEYRSRLYRSIANYAGQILARPDPPLDDQWDDFTALQQVTLGDWNEEWLQKILE